MSTGKPSICLNMIVKNESHIIVRCLDSIKDVIDYWVISDTGSNDGTQEIISNYFDQHRIPGILTQDEWQNFAHNRNIALRNAQGKSDYILIMDADDYLMAGADFHFGNLTADHYMLRMRRNGIDYFFPKLIRSNLPWQWQGVLHEYLECSQTYTSDSIQGDYRIISTTEGARSHNPDKYKRDAEILERALQQEPNNARYQFYLAQSYRDYGDLEQAITHYQKRADMGGWEEEVFYSLLEIAHCKQWLNHPESETLNAFLKAHHYRPQRLEALYEAVKICRINANYHLGQQLGWEARHTSMPQDILFLDKTVYDWKFRDELSICAVYTGQPQEAVSMMESLLASKLTPDDQKPRLEANRRYAVTLIHGS